MSLFQQTLTQAVLPADIIHPANYAANTYTTTGMNMSKAGRALYTLQVGVITGAATIDANLQSATNANFSDAVNINATNITQITSTNNSNTCVRIEVRADQVIAQTAGDKYVRLRVVLGTNAAFLAATGVMAPLYNKPALTNTGLNTAVLIENTVCSI